MVDVDRSDPDLKFLVVDRNAFSDPATQESFTLFWIDVNILHLWRIYDMTLKLNKIQH